MKKIILLIIITIAIISCKTIGIQKQTYNQVELATIGALENKLTKQDFQTNVIPNLVHKVRVGLTLNTFTKKSFLNYTNAVAKLDKNTNLKYIDSLPNKPKYNTLTILDKVSLLNNLNSTKNTTAINYLKTAINPKIITEITLVLPSNLQKSLQDAEEIYLIQNKYKKYSLEVIKQDHKQIINFIDATVFNFKSTYFCWGENKKHQIQIVDINTKCSKPTFKSYQKAKKHKSTFNFIKL